MIQHKVLPHQRWLHLAPAVCPDCGMAGGHTPHCPHDPPDEEPWEEDESATRHMTGKPGPFESASVHNQRMGR